jgi:GR25 family glycosyltransferase involved in LPS biosynthesis
MNHNAYVITLSDNVDSFTAADRLIDSSNHYKNEFTIQKFNAITPDRVIDLMTLHNLKWNYPMSTPVLDMQTGLWKHPYVTAVTEKRIACFLSHYLLWKKCAKSEESIFIFEHDALFINKVDYATLNESKFDIIALNDPRGATRKASEYYEAVKLKLPEKVVPVPKIDQDQIPQGLPGNSAYYIKPQGAIKLLSLVHEFGAWPNDAIMCRQLMPKKLGIVTDFCTKVQGIKSTTTTA